jgi:hypothetical protein
LLLPFLVGRTAGQNINFSEVGSTRSSPSRPAHRCVLSLSSWLCSSHPHIPHCRSFLKATEQNHALPDSDDEFPRLGGELGGFRRKACRNGARVTWKSPESPTTATQGTEVYVQTSFPPLFSALPSFHVTVLPSGYHLEPLLVGGWSLGVGSLCAVY